MKRTGLMLLALAAAVCFMAPLSRADDAYVWWDDPMEIPGLGEDAWVAAEHADEDDGYGFKGWAYVGLKNTGTAYWDGLKISIFDATVGATTYDSTSVQIIGTSPYQPSSMTHTISGFTIGNTLDGHATLDISFAGDLIAPNETLLVTFYTDNTAEQVPYFGIAFYPVPEPASGTLVAFIAAAGFFIRRRYGR